MMTSGFNQKLDRFYKFFETYGTERLNGLDESYFAGLSEYEKKEAWNYLLKGDSLSDESIKGLYLLDKNKAVFLFKKILGSPLQDSPYPDQRQAFERSRLLMLSYVNNTEPDEEHVVAMSKFARSEFAEVRGQFAQCLPTHQLAPQALQALKEMVLTEAERSSRTLAITKLMLIYGLDFDMDDPLYKSIYLSLRADDPKEKLSAMKRLEVIRSLGESN